MDELTLAETIRSWEQTRLQLDAFRSQPIRGGQKEPMVLLGGVGNYKEADSGASNRKGGSCEA